MLMAGIDEAGRGPLAGPVVAAAVILDPTRKIRGLRDSKVMTPEAREHVATEIRAKCIAWAVASSDVGEIDALNILRATLLAMRRAVLAQHRRQRREEAVHRRRDRIRVEQRMKLVVQRA